MENNITNKGCIFLFNAFILANYEQLNGLYLNENQIKENY